MIRVRTAALLLALLAPLAGVAEEDGNLVIRSASYGSQGRSCNATDIVARMCNGAERCVVAASDGLCGDPYYGARKSLTVVFACGGFNYTAKTREGDRPLNISCGLINVQGAAFGAKGRYCNALPSLQEACNGKSYCAVPVNDELCGDPIYQIKKRLRLTYLCGERQMYRSVLDGQSAKLRCATW